MAEFHGAKVALFLGEHLVTIQRDDIPGIPYPGLWDLPGGGREGQETPFQTVARELREEVGLNLPQSAVHWHATFDAQHIENARVHFFVARMSADLVDRIVFGNEGQQWALMRLADFITHPLIVPSYPARLARWQAETGGF